MAVVQEFFNKTRLSEPNGMDFFVGISLVFCTSSTVYDLIKLSEQCKALGF